MQCSLPNDDVLTKEIQAYHELQSQPEAEQAQQMGQQMVIYANSPADDQEGRIGDLALARLYEAYVNITPATRREKLRSSS